MTTRWLCLALLLAGCAQTPPVTQPNPFQAQQLEIVHRQMLGRDEARVKRVSLNAALSEQQVAVSTNQVLRQQAWEARTFEGSPNVTAKVTTTLEPMDAKGRIMEQQILTYYDHGTMRYATNKFDKVKSP